MSQPASPMLASTPRSSDGSRSRSSGSTMSTAPATPGISTPRPNERACGPIGPEARSPGPTIPVPQPERPRQQRHDGSVQARHPRSPLIIDSKAHPSPLKSCRIPRAAVPGRELDLTLPHREALSAALPNQPQDGLDGGGGILHEVLVAHSHITTRSAPKQDLGERVPVQPLQRKGGGPDVVVSAGVAASAARLPSDPRIYRSQRMSDEVNNIQIH